MRYLRVAIVVACGLWISAAANANVVHSTFTAPNGSLSFDGWNQLNRTGMGGGDQTIATDALVNGFTANVAGSGDAVLKRLSGTMYPAGAGTYGGGVLQISDNTLPTGFDGLVLQGIINDFGGTFGESSLALSYNGGSQSLQPILASFVSTGGIEDYYRFRWDLSGVSDSISSYQIEATFDFGQVLALQVDATAVPEPATMLALAAASIGKLGLSLRRRRAQRAALQVAPAV